MAKVILSFWNTFGWCINLTDILCETSCMPDNYGWFTR